MVIYTALNLDDICFSYEMNAKCDVRVKCCVISRN